MRTFFGKLGITVRDAVKRNVAKNARGCSLTNKQTNEARTDGHIRESHESIHVDNKQACPRVSHLVLTNNCAGEFLFAMSHARGISVSHSTEFSRRKTPRTMYSPVPRLFCKLYPLILMIPSWHQQAISILGVIVCIPLYGNAHFGKTLHTILLILNYTDCNNNARQ